MTTIIVGSTFPRRRMFYSILAPTSSDGDGKEVEQYWRRERQRTVMWHWLPSMLLLVLPHPSYESGIDT